MRRGAAENRSPFVEVSIGPPISRLKSLGGHPQRTEHGVAGVIKVPVPVKDSLLIVHSLEQGCSRIRCQDMKCRGLDALIGRPLHGSVKNTFVIAIHSENEA